MYDPRMNRSGRFPGPRGIIADDGDLSQLLDESPVLHARHDGVDAPEPKNNPRSWHPSVVDVLEETDDSADDGDDSRHGNGDGGDHDEGDGADKSQGKGAGSVAGNGISSPIVDGGNGNGNGSGNDNGKGTGKGKGGGKGKGKGKGKGSGKSKGKGKSHVPSVVVRRKAGASTVRGRSALENLDDVLDAIEDADPASPGVAAHRQPGVSPEEEYLVLSGHGAPGHATAGSLYPTAARKGGKHSPSSGGSASTASTLGLTKTPQLPGTPTTSTTPPAADIGATPTATVSGAAAVMAGVAGGTNPLAMMEKLDASLESLTAAPPSRAGESKSTSGGKNIAAGGASEAAHAGSRVSSGAATRPSRLDSAVSTDWIGDGTTFFGDQVKGAEKATKAKARSREWERREQASVFSSTFMDDERKANEFRARYDPQEWLSFLVSTHGSVLGKIWLRVLMVTSFSVLVCIYDHYIYEIPEMTTAGHQIGGAALSLFITFRTNSSYSRFYEAVHLFGQIMATCQQMARMSLSFISGSQPPVRAAKVRILRLLSVFPLAAKRDLRAVENKEELRMIWNDPQFHDLLDAMDDIPAAILQAVGYYVRSMEKQSACSEPVALHLESMISEIAKLWAAASKISASPVPYVFAIEGTRMIIAFLLTLPVVLVPYFGWYTIAVLFFLAYEFMAIEAAGSEVEDPYGIDSNDAPLSALTAKHMETITQLAKAHELLRRHAAKME